MGAGLKGGGKREYYITDCFLSLYIRCFLSGFVIEDSHVRE